MLKVFLIEDEIVVRRGIKDNIHWEENGFTFCGEASDGELAYPMIKDIKPDIVITDIRMPFMNGLEISRLIKEEMPWIKVIILSGYEEFDYAKEAIEIGVTKYLLKPISSAELLECLEEVRVTILKEQEEKLNNEIFKMEMQEYEEDEKRRLFNNIINKSESPAKLLERGKKLNIELSSMYYLIILFQFDVQPAKSKELVNNNGSVTLVNGQGTNFLKVDVLDKLSTSIREEDNIIHFDLLFGKHALLLKANSLEGIIKEKDNCIEKVKAILASHKKIIYFGGIGNPVNRLGELEKSFVEASRAFAYRYILDTNDILNYQEIKKEITSEISNDDLDGLNIKQLDNNKVENFLKSGSKEDITYFAEEYLNSIYKKESSSLILRQYIILDIYCIVCSFVEKLGFEMDSIDTPLFCNLKYEQNIASSEYSLNYVVKIFNQAIDLRNEIVTREDNKMINKAKEFISENYFKDDLSLNHVASEVYLSSSHFSSVFSQKTGQTFINYLTELRLNKAKELLKCTNKRISEIGYSVGYKDPHYFSFLFKKTQNCTPSQYRNNKK